MNKPDKPISAWIKDVAGQAFTVEALLSVVLLTSIVYLVAPAYAVPITEERMVEENREQKINTELSQLVEEHRENGQMKALVLNYYDDQWQEDKQRTDDPNGFGDETYQIGPRGGGYAVPGQTNRSGQYFTPPGPVGASVADLEANHDVWINMYLYPERNGTASGSDTPTSEKNRPDRIEFVSEDTSDTVVAREKTTMVFFDNDHLRTLPASHDRVGSTLSIHRGPGNSLESGSEFPIEDDRLSGNDDVYTVVDVSIVAYQNTSATPNEPI